MGEFSNCSSPHKKTLAIHRMMREFFVNSLQRFVRKNQFETAPFDGLLRGGDEAELLFDLADRDIEKGWKCFELASVETVDFICRGLEMNGENEIAGNLRKMKAIQPFQIKYVRDYLVSNANYLQTKMMMYVRDNIEKFN